MARVRGTRSWVLALAAGLLVGWGISRDEGGSNRGGVAQTAAKPAAAGDGRKERAEALDAALADYAAGAPEFSVAVLDRRAGERYSFRGAASYETASVAKVQVLACLLLAAQDDGRALTGTEMALAGRMMRLSDNDATTALYHRLGRAPALAAGAARFGLSGTIVHKRWGLTRTTVDDQVLLLAGLADECGPLTAGSRDLVAKLMGSVDRAQDWGVPAAGRAGETCTVKNGWLSRSTEDGRYIVNSVGRIIGGTTDVAVAVLSHGNPTMASGIALVVDVARMTRAYLDY